MRTLEPYSLNHPTCYTIDVRPLILQDPHLLSTIAQMIIQLHRCLDPVRTLLMVFDKRSVQRTTSDPFVLNTPTC